MNELKGKVAIVTGASTQHGIGRAIAKRFAQAGASLYLVADRTQQQLDDAASECLGVEGCGAVKTGIFDLGQPGQPEAMVARAHQLLGRVDVLINNAGIRAPYDFGDFERSTFDRMISVNLAAAFFASQAAVPIMRAQGGGRIIHITSQMGQVAAPQGTLYGLTKAALIHLTKSMAVELCKDNIIVNALSPGPIATQPLRDMGMSSMRDLYEKTPDQLESVAVDINKIPSWNTDKHDKLPIGRLGEPDEVANVALYLAATSPAFLMGEDIVVDGGYLLQ